VNDGNKNPDRLCRGTLCKRGRLFTEIAVFVLLMVLVYIYQTRNLISSDGVPAPTLSGQLLDGDNFDIADLNSVHTLVYFFAPWCAYCSASMDNINRLRRWEDMESLSIVLVAIDWQSSDEISGYADRHGLNVPIVLAERDDAKRWRVYAFPTYYVLDKDRRIVSSDMGYSTMAGLYLRTR
jgi:peroxiredoxin